MRREWQCDAGEGQEQDGQCANDDDHRDSVEMNSRVLWVGWYGSVGGIPAVTEEN
jgi:hypothetical protein